MALYRWSNEKKPIHLTSLKIYLFPGSFRYNQSLHQAIVKLQAAELKNSGNKTPENQKAFHDEWTRVTDILCQGIRESLMYD